MFADFGNLARQKKVMELAFQQSFLKGKLEGLSEAGDYKADKLKTLMNTLEKELVAVTEKLNEMHAKIRK